MLVNGVLIQGSITLRCLTSEVGRLRSMPQSSNHILIKTLSSFSTITLDCNIKAK